MITTATGDLQLPIIPGVVKFNMAAKSVLRSCYFARNTRFKRSSFELFSRNASYFTAQRNSSVTYGVFSGQRRIFRNKKASFPGQVLSGIKYMLCEICTVQFSVYVQSLCV